MNMFDAFELTNWALLGALGIAFIEISYLPQIFRLYKKKVADDISLFFPGLNLLGRLCAFAYAMHASIEVFALGFLVGIALRATLFFQVLYYRSFRPWLEKRREFVPVQAAVTTIVSGEPR